MEIRSNNDKWMDVEVLESSKCTNIERRAPGLVQKCSPLLHSCRIQLSGCWSPASPTGQAPVCYLQSQKKVSASCIFKGHHRINKTYINSVSHHPTIPTMWGWGWGGANASRRIILWESSSSGGDSVVYVLQTLFTFFNILLEKVTACLKWCEKGGRGSERVGVRGGGALYSCEQTWAWKSQHHISKPITVITAPSQNGFCQGTPSPLRAAPVKH